MLKRHACGRSSRPVGFGAGRLSFSATSKPEEITGPPQLSSVVSMIHIENHDIIFVHRRKRQPRMFLYAWRTEDPVLQVHVQHHIFRFIAHRAAL
jgi:hypothetical protein